MKKLAVQYKTVKQFVKLVNALEGLGLPVSESVSEDADDDEDSAYDGCGFLAIVKGELVRLAEEDIKRDGFTVVMPLQFLQNIDITALEQEKNGSSKIDTAAGQANVSPDGTFVSVRGYEFSFGVIKEIYESMSSRMKQSA